MIFDLSNWRNRPLPGPRALSTPREGPATPPKPPRKRPTARGSEFKKKKKHQSLKIKARTHGRAAACVAVTIQKPTGRGEPPKESDCPPLNPASMGGLTNGFTLTPLNRQPSQCAEGYSEGDLVAMLLRCLDDDGADGRSAALNDKTFVA